MRISEHIRSCKADVGEKWEQVLRSSCPRLSELDRASLIDHLPEFLEGLAAWIEGDEVRAIEAFEALAVGHALQRFGHGIDLDTLTIEYQVLRSEILRSLLEIELDTPELRRDLMRLNEGMDHAVLHAVRRYVGARDEVRERFIGVLAHDLRGPLQVAQLALAQLAHGDERTAGLATRGLRAIDRIDRMVRDVLDFARGHLGTGIPITPSEDDMGAICAAVVEEAHATLPARTIALDARGDLRGYWDRDRVVQALGNLVGNALEHGRDPIAVRAYDDGHFVITEIENRGDPIAPELLQRMFEPFHRAAGSQGLGLGLFIARAIATAHGALCAVTSERGLTRVRITWPRAFPEETPGRP